MSDPLFDALPVALGTTERLHTTLAAITSGVIVQDATGAIIYANEGAQQIFGLSLDQLREPTSLDPRWRVTREEGAELTDTERPARRALLTGQPQRQVITSVTLDNGERRWVQTDVVPVLDTTGAVEQVVATCTDITERRWAEQRAAFLTQVSGLLASSLDYETTLATVAQLVVPRLADWCSVDILGEDGMLHTLAVAHVDPAKVALAHELQRRYPPDPQ